MSVYFPQVVIPAAPPRATVDVSITVRGGSPTGSVVALRDASWQLHAVFTENTRLQKFPFGALQGEYFLIGHKYTEPKAASTRLVTLTGEDQSFYLDIDEGQRPQGGIGLLSGSFPLSMITQEGNLPSQSIIRILYRPEQGAGGDGYVVATTTCNADGTWQVSDLNESLKYDIVARIPGYNDVLISDVQPTGAPLSAHFAGIKEEYEYGEEVSIQVVALGGRPPYSYTAVNLPVGLEFDPVTRMITGAVISTGVVDILIEVSDANEDTAQAHYTWRMEFDPYWGRVVSLMHFDGDFSDETGEAVTIEGDLSFAPGKFSEAVRFTRSTNPRTLIRKSGLNIGTGDFTVEAWVKLSSLSLDNAIFDFRLGTGTSPLPLVESDGGNLYVWVSGSYLIGPIASAMSASQFQHLALVRSSGVLSLWLDGILVGTALYTHDMGNAQLSIGRSMNTGSSETRYDLAGDIDELRITQGIARYTKNFDPPTTPFPNIGPPETVDPYWGNVVSLLHFEGLPGSSNFIDQHSVVWTGGGAAKLSSDQFKFGGSSLELDGSPSWIQAPPAAGLFGDSDFTVEMQIFPQSVSGGYATLAGVWDNVSGGRVWVVYQLGNGLVFEYSTSGSNNYTVNSSSVLLLAEDWSHIAVCRSGSVIRIFIRGQLAGEAQIGSRVLRGETSRPLSIGYLPPPVSFGAFNGYVDEFRITKGVARYIKNFTPPTQPFPNIGLPVDEPELPTVIGEEFGGGYYIGNITIADGSPDDGEYAIIMGGPESQAPTTLAWRNPPSTTAGTDSTTNGRANTLAMQTDDPVIHDAGMYCLDYVGGGFNDWYLPAKDELNLAWVNRSQLAALAMDAQQYWNSTQSSSVSAWYQNFSTGSQLNSSKIANYRVRPVRRLKI